MLALSALLALATGTPPDDTIKPAPTVLAQESQATPFFSQFNDISDKFWSKRSCGIASLAMVIAEHFPKSSVSPDSLLQAGREIGGYSPNGWVHSKLVELAGMHGLHAEAIDVSGKGRAEALLSLKHSLETGPALASVHYKLDPKNPIPHLIVVHAMDKATVTISDPANKHGDETVSLDKFSHAWKERYISFSSEDSEDAHQ